MYIYSLYISSCTFASTTVSSASCCAATADACGLLCWWLRSNEARHALAFGFHFPFRSNFYNWRCNIYSWHPQPTSCNAFSCRVAALHFMDANIVCPLCQKTTRALPSTTHTCICCNAPMQTWCGFGSCRQNELGGSCCFRCICHDCMVGCQQQILGSVQQPWKLLQWPVWSLSAYKRAQAWIDVSSENDLMSCSKDTDRDSDYKQVITDAESADWGSGGELKAQ